MKYENDKYFPNFSQEVLINLERKVLLKKKKMWVLFVGFQTEFMVCVIVALMIYS